MNIIIALVVSALLYVSPVKGPAPFEPTVAVVVKGPFQGAACIEIAEKATPETVVYGQCLVAVAAKDETKTVYFTLTGHTAGEFIFIGYVIDLNQVRTALNSVEVTVE